MLPALGATLRRGWSRPWLRRTALGLVAGGMVAGSLGWTLRQPFTTRWILNKLDALCREQTGLSLTAEALEVHPLDGRVIVRGLALGGDLAQVGTLSLRLSYGPLLRGQPVLDRIDLDHLKLRLDARRLAQIHLKPSDPKKAPLEWELHGLWVRGGEVQIAEPAWGLPRAWAHFGLEGRSLGPRRLILDLKAPELGAELGGKLRIGQVDLRATLEPERIRLRGAELRLGGAEASAQGDLDLKQATLSAHAKLGLELSELQGIAGMPRIGEGKVTAKADLNGPLNGPAWKLELQSPRLALAGQEGRPGALALRAAGSAERVDLESLRWQVAEGVVEAEGMMGAAASRFRFRVPRLGLAPWAGVLHLPALSRITTEGEGTVGWKGWIPESLTGVEGRLGLGFQDNGQEAGRLVAGLKGGALEVATFQLQLPEVDLTAKGAFKLGPKGLQTIAAEGRVATDAADVARALSAWKVTDLDMSGRVEAQASIGWSRPEGFTLQAEADITEPRWHQARADRLRTKVSIERSELQLRDVFLEKGEGDARGELWLSWADLPKEHDQIDFCFRARDLPIREGLGAADLADLDITGSGSGWIRARGPYKRMQMEGSALAQEALVYGIKLPAFSGDFSWDLDSNRMRLTELRVAGSPAQLSRDEAMLVGGLDLRGGAEFDFQRMRFKGQFQGEVESTALGLPGPRISSHLDARFDGGLAEDFGPWVLPEGRVTLNGGRVVLGEQTLEGLEAELSVGQGNLDLKGGLQGFPESLVRLRLMTEGTGLIGALDLQVDGSTVNTEHLAARLTRDLLEDGALNLQAEGIWSEAGWDWRGRLETLSGRFSGFELAQTRPSELRADGHSVEFDLNLEGKGTEEGSRRGAHLQAQGELPFLASEPLRVNLKGDADLGELKAVVDHVLDLDPFSVLHQIQVAGTASLDLRAGGTYRDPRLDGDLKLRGGRFSTTTRPQSLEDVSMDLRFQGQELVISEEKPLQGRLAQGDLKAWGRTHWKLDGVGDYELRAKVDDFQLRDLPEGFELQGSVDATLSGKGNGRGLIKGALTARSMSYRAELNLGDIILSSSLKSLSGLGGLDPEDLLTRIDLDLDLVLLQPWKFDTNLLKLEGQPYGGFKVQGTLAKPGLWGRMEFIPGGLITNLLPAGDIKVERGFINFTDPRIFNPFLNVEGQINISPYLVTLNIRGTLDSLDLRPSSTPSLRQDEIIAILLDPGMVDSVGTGATNTQSAVNTGLAQTTSSLITTLALANLQEGLRRTLNLDRVSFAFRPGVTGTYESNLSVGKSIDVFGRRMPVTISRRNAGELITNSVQVEWRLGNLVVQLGASQTAPEPAGISGEIRHTWSPK